MTQARAWKPFLRNDDNFLRLAITCRETGIPASRRLKIKDEVLGLDLDYAVSLRLLQFDTMRDKQRARFIAAAVLGGVEGKDLLVDDDILSADTLHLLIANDKYADGNTQIM